jgi:putative transposase
MRDLIILLVHLITTVFRLARPGALRSVVAESVLIKHQLLIVNRSRRRAPNLRVCDRLIADFCSLWIRPHRLVRSTIAFKPSTLLNFHRALVRRKYRLLFAPKRRAKPGPKGPDQDLIRAVVDMKQRNPRWGCPRIAGQIELAFGISITKDVVRRILAAHYHAGWQARPCSNINGSARPLEFASDFLFIQWDKMQFSKVSPHCCSVVFHRI